MEKIRNNKILSFIVSVIGNAIVAMIIWPLLDMFFTCVIDKQTFTYSATNHIFEPILYGIFLTIFTMIFKHIDAKKSNKETK